MKYTITRALAEFKTLKNRYQKEVGSSMLIGVKVGKKMRAPHSSYQPEAFSTQATKQYQSITDLYKRILEIKTKIDQSNFVTKVTIAGKEYTVLEALEMKNVGLELKKDRLSELKRQMMKARTTYDDALDENKRRIEKMVSEQTAAGSKDAELEKKAVDSIEAIYKVDFVDPIELQKKIDELEEDIASFENEVNYALSESNSTTYIEVEG